MKTHPLVTSSPYEGYVYGYPHKTAYQALTPPIPLASAWEAEPKDALSLYVHVPFCEMRCGFCNLFTLASPDGTLVDQWLAALERHARATIAALGPTRRFARAALGGGTPTWLAPRELDRVLGLAREVMREDVARVPCSVEVSPSTADGERLAVLAAHGVSRVSIGVQSFDGADVRAMGRPQDASEVQAALARIRAAGFPTLNIDLIYGAVGQTRASWLRTIDAALAWRPEELYLYPLYVRHLTGLDKRGVAADDDNRLELYRAGRDHLAAQGYTQVSMRMFARADLGGGAGPAYCCQADGMVGLGAGARSYTRALHYATRYAVSRAGVRAIVSDFAAASEDELASASHGFVLDAAEQRRRWLLLSLLQAGGFDRQDYVRTFGGDVAHDFPELDVLAALGLATVAGSVGVTGVRLTAAGLERSDMIGPWLHSDAVRRRMEGYAWS